MKILNRLYGWYGKRTVLTVLAVVLILVITGVIFSFISNKPAEEMPQESLRRVEVSRVDALGSQSLFNVIGNVRAVSEARLQAEAGGRITSVNAKIGDSVHAGAIIATFENSAQHASLLQAEGAYEAAVASAATSNSSEASAQTGYDAARTSAVNTYKSAYISTDSSVRNTIDDLFSNPTGSIPGFKLDARGEAPYLNEERKSLEAVLDSWSMDVQSVRPENVESRLSEARTDVERVARFAEELAQIVSAQDINASFTQAQKDALEAELLGVRSTLNGTAQGLEGSQTAIASAREGLDRAQIAASNGTVSLSEAQLKSALGTLRAAQAAYEKTLVRTPISGVVNALYLKVGEYATPGAPAVVVANNNALEISTALSDDDANIFAVGDTVFINGTTNGVITAIAPAIDPISGKKEIRIGIPDEQKLTNGDTVTIEFKRNEERKTDVISLPLSALKITADEPLAFTVNEDNTLASHKVTLGKIMGDTVEVVEGLTPDMVIVTDARGLREGEKVEVITQ